MGRNTFWALLKSIAVRALAAEFVENIFTWFACSSRNIAIETCNSFKLPFTAAMADGADDITYNAMRRRYFGSRTAGRTFHASATAKAHTQLV